MKMAAAMLVVITVRCNRLERSHILEERLPSLGHATLGWHQVQNPSCTRRIGAILAIRSKQGRGWHGR